MTDEPIDRDEEIFHDEDLLAQQAAATPDPNERYVAFAVMARFTGQDLDSIITTIQTLLGCDGTEDDCPMVMCSSTVADKESAFRWLGVGDD